MSEQKRKEPVVSARLGRFALAAFEGNEGKAPWYKLVYTEKDQEAGESRDRWIFLNQTDLAVLRELFGAHLGFPFGPMIESNRRQ